jgi:hypothetical protein
MISDLVPAQSVVVGVDASKPRLSLCKNIIQKYHIDRTTSGMQRDDTKEDTAVHNTAQNMISRVNIRLYCGDGTTFGAAEQSTSSASELMFDSSSAVTEHVFRGKRKRMNKSARAREKRRLQELSSRSSTVDETSTDDQKIQQACPIEPNEKSDSAEADAIPAMPPFDRVLVDAECSSDGAIRHINKRQSSTIAKEPLWDDSNMNELVDLQKRLIDSGFRLVKSGGILVYSTCSLSSRQNEEVVEWLLKQYKNAFVIPVSFLGHQHNISTSASSDVEFIQEGTIKGTVRFKPDIFRDNSQSTVFSGGGFFLAKIGKQK